jgi:hypothetical protein
MQGVLPGHADGHADPHSALFEGELALDAAARQTLVHWLEAGAPRGSGADPLRLPR